MKPEDKVYLEKLGKRIATKRKEKKISQDTLVSLCDMEKANLSRIENGKINPTILTLRKISAAMGDDLCRFFEEERN